MGDPRNGANDAFNRMKRAHDRGTGCRLTADMIASLGCTLIAEIWAQADPRAEKAQPKVAGQS